MLARVGPADLRRRETSGIGHWEDVGETLRGRGGRDAARPQGDDRLPVEELDGAGSRRRRPGDQERAEVQPELADVGRAPANLEPAVARRLRAGRLEVGRVLVGGRPAILVNCARNKK